jgi:Trk K+ transport system NAD-binding subunit
LIISIERPEGTIIPRGDTILRPGDRLIIFVQQDRVTQLHEHLAAVGAGTARSSPAS